MPRTCPRSPTSCRARKLTSPRPQPMSSTRRPSRTPASTAAAASSLPPGQLMEWLWSPITAVCASRSSPARWRRAWRVQQIRFGAWRWSPGQRSTSARRASIASRTALASVHEGLQGAFSAASNRFVSDRRSVLHRCSVSLGCEIVAARKLEHSTAEYVRGISHCQRCRSLPLRRMFQRNTSNTSLALPRLSPCTFSRFSES